MQGDIHGHPALSVNPVPGGTTGAGPSQVDAGPVPETEQVGRVPAGAPPGTGELLTLTT